MPRADEYILFNEGQPLYLRRMQLEQLHLAQHNTKQNRVSFAQPIGADRTKMAFVRFGRLGAGHLTSKSWPS